MPANPKRIGFFIALSASAALATALYLQHVEFQSPCPLCILQRYAYLLAALAVLPACLGRAPRTFWSLAFASTAGGIVTAGLHVWKLYHPVSSCGRDPLAAAINDWPPARWLPQVFYADGLCGDPLPPLFGLSLPVWSLLGLLFITLLLWRMRALVWRG